MAIIGSVRTPRAAASSSPAARNDQAPVRRDRPDPRARQAARQRVARPRAPRAPPRRHGEQQLVVLAARRPRPAGPRPRASVEPAPRLVGDGQRVAVDDGADAGWRRPARRHRVSETVAEIDAGARRRAFRPSSRPRRHARLGPQKARLAAPPSAARRRRTRRPAGALPGPRAPGRPRDPPPPRRSQPLTKMPSPGLRAGARQDPPRLDGARSRSRRRSAGPASARCCRRRAHAVIGRPGPAGRPSSSSTSATGQRRGQHRATAAPARGSAPIAARSLRLTASALCPMARRRHEPRDRSAPPRRGRRSSARRARFRSGSTHRRIVADADADPGGRRRHAEADPVDDRALAEIGDGRSWLAMRQRPATSRTRRRAFRGSP